MHDLLLNCSWPSPAQWSWSLTGLLAVFIPVWWLWGLRTTHFCRYSRTDAQSASQSWCQSQSRSQEQVLLLSLAISSMWGAVSEERTALSFSALTAISTFHLYLQFCTVIVKSHVPCGYLLYAALHVTLVRGGIGKFPYCYYCNCLSERRWEGRSRLHFRNIFLHLLLLGHPEHSSSSTETLPALKCECYSKPTVRLKEYSPKSSRSISGFQ
jgi:hypothetical protein